MNVRTLFALLLFVSSPVWAQEAPLKNYKPLARTFCKDVQLPCMVMIPKETDVFFAVFSKRGELIAITRMHDGRETVIWGELKLPIKDNEKEL